MSVDYEKYLVREPLYEAGGGVKNRQSPAMTFLSRTQVPEASYYLELGWIKGMPDPNPHIYEHSHSCDEIILLWGCDYKTPQVLGAEIEFYIGGQQINVNTTCGMFIPRGVPHGPLTWKKFNRPHMQMSLLLGAGSREEAWGGNGIDRSQGSIPRKTSEIDYEQYVIRSPMREAGAEFTRGRTAPTMTYMSGVQIPGVKTYIEFGWTFDLPLSSRTGAGMPPMAHKNFDEIVLHMGGDPDNPLDLGGEVEFYVGGQPLHFNTSTALYVPRNLVHGPLACTKYLKPHIVMAIMLGAGNLKDGWADSFKQ
jgi:hypothetical protein